MAVELVVIAVLLVALFAIVRFEQLCLHELSATRDVDLRYLTRSGWTAVILVVIPIGGVAFLYAGRRT